MDSPELSVPHAALLEHAAWVRQLAAELVRDPGAADDLAQETWLAFLRARPDPRRPLRPWLATVLRHAAGLRARKGAVRRAREEAVARPEGVPGADQLVERAEQQQRLARTVLALGEPYRETLLLRYYEGLGPSEIARARGLPAATVRTHLFRGLEQLRQKLDAQHGGDRGAWVAMLMPLVPRGTTTRPEAAGLGPAALAGLTLGAAAVVALVVSALWIAGDRGGRSAALEGPREVPAALGEGVAQRAEAREPERAVAAPRERPVLLVDGRGEPLSHYAVRVDGRALRSDARGQLALPADARELVPVDDARLALDARTRHGLRERLELEHASVILPPGDGDARVVVPAGPGWQLALSIPAGIEPGELAARLSAEGPAGLRAEGRAHQLAPVRAAGGAFELPWVRFAADPEGAGEPGSALRLELRDAAGLWEGVAEPGGASVVPVELRSTAVLEGRVDGLQPGERAETQVALCAGSPEGPVLAWTLPDETGRYALRWLPPGEHLLVVRGRLHATFTAAVELHGGERQVLDVALEPAPPAGPVAGIVTSDSNAYSGQVLVFLLDAAGRTLGVHPATWSVDENGRRTAPFRFEAAPPGELRLEVLSLADCVGFRASPDRFAAPFEELRVTLEDERPASDWELEVQGAETGSELETFELEVRLDGGAPRRFPAERGADGSYSWTLLAGGLRWHRFEAATPLLGLHDAARLEWELRAPGHAPARGDETAFDVIEPGRRRATVRLAPERD